jgi:hypothetical protein
MRMRPRLSLPQGRYSELVRILIDAAVQLPEPFGERDSIYASDDLRGPWVTATRTWESMTRVRELVSAFDDFRDLDPDWSKVHWTKSARVAEATLFREQTCELGEPGSIEFALNLARACADNPAEMWLPTARQASDLAQRLWAGGIDLQAGGRLMFLSLAWQYSEWVRTS